MNTRLLLGLVAVCCLVSVVASEAPRAVMGRGVIPRPEDWKFIGLPARDSPVVFNIALKQQNVDILEATLYAVSDPKSERYGKYFSIDEILDIVAPPKEDHDYVIAWLLNNGILKSEIKSLRDAIKVTTTVASAEALLQTKFVMYQCKRSGMQRTVVEDVFSVPLDIESLIDMITGITEFPHRISRKVQDRGEVNVNEPEYYSSPDMIVPETIKTLYNFTEAESTIDNADASQGVVEFLGYGSFVESDLTHFFKGVGYPFDKTAIIVGPYYPNGFLESELDIQYIMGVARNATSYYWTVEGWMYDFALDAFVDKNIPLVFSMSYAWTESSQCDLGGTRIDNCTKSDTYVNRTSVEFMKLGTRGVTLLAASGDQGAPGDANTECTAVFKHLYPLFPAASPYVLSVGATMLINETPFTGQKPPVCNTHTCASGGEEVTCMYPTALITSGGGFSDYAPRPSYQDSAVEAYFANTTTQFPPSSQFNKNNRGYPDVAGLGHSYLIVDEGSWEVVDGTSCSTPMWGAIITVLNNIRLNQNKPPLGFVNPLIYQIAAEDPAAFQDITLGNNKCTEVTCCKVGYYAAPGWDAVTGLGTPNVGRLMDYVRNMAN